MIRLYETASGVCAPARTLTVEDTMLQLERHVFHEDDIEELSDAVFQQVAWAINVASRGNRLVKVRQWGAVAREVVVQEGEA